MRAFSDFEERRYAKVLDAYVKKHRPPPEMRQELDLGYRIAGQSVEIFEIRPVWDDPARKIEEAVAKATYVKTRKAWRVYWQRADLKWHRYDPAPEVKSIEEFLQLVEQDEWACFYG